jgi:hypothetical protein
MIVIGALAAACGSRIGVPESSPGASASVDPAPRVIDVTASESTLAITYDRPMKHGLACGTKGMVAGPSRTIDAFEMNITTSYYRSADPVFDEFLQSLWEAELNRDCSGVLFTFVHGVAPGTYPLSIRSVQDQAGRPLAQDPTTVTVNVRETAPPKYLLVQHAQDKVVVSLSEPIKTALATDPAHYRLNGAPLPAGSTVACAFSCARVVITLPSARTGLQTITTVGLEDLAGKPFAAGTETTDVQTGATGGAGRP